MRCHAGLLQQTSIGVLKVSTRNPVATAREGRGMAVVHAEEGGGVAALVHLADQLEEVRFGAAKRIVIFVAIKDAHGRRPMSQCGSGTGPQSSEDFVVGCRNRRRSRPRRAGCPQAKPCSSKSIAQTRRP